MKFNKGERLKIKDIANNYGLPVSEVEKIIKSQYLFMKDKVEELNIKEIKTKEEFDAQKTNFNIPAIGKLYASWAIFKKINKIEE